MPRHQVPSASRHSASGAVRRGPRTESLSVLHRRLANAERELRVEYTRIAQLQAHLDVVVGALRRGPDGAHAHVG